jgi:hypothetical protein
MSSKGVQRYKRALLVGSAVLLILIAWPLYVVVAEHIRLSGKWILLTADGKEIPDETNRPICVTLTWPNFSVNPFCNPKRIDYQIRGLVVTTVSVRGIYQWEGNRVWVAGSTGDLLRPTSFDPNKLPPFETRVLPVGSYVIYLLRRPSYSGEETVPLEGANGLPKFEMKVQR